MHKLFTLMIRWTDRVILLVNEQCAASSSPFISLLFKILKVT